MKLQDFEVKGLTEWPNSLTRKGRLFLTGSLAKNKKFIRTTFLGFLFLSLVGIYGYTAIEAAIKKEMQAQLSNSLDGTSETIRLWVERQRGLISIILRDAEVHDDLLRLLRGASTSETMHKLQPASGTLNSLRLKLAPVLQQNGWVDFYVIDRNGQQVGSLMEDKVGPQVFSSKGTFFERSLGGDTVVSLPFGIESSKVTMGPSKMETDLAQFTSTPIRDEQGQVAGILAMRIDPVKSFYPLFDMNRRGDTGESYIFDLSGVMLSDSRFNGELRQIGLISPMPDSRAQFVFRVCHPHHRNQRSQTGGHCKLTPMAAQAAKGEMGIDVDGVIDYRGKTVVGSWAWLDDPGMGLIVKMDSDEAYSTLTLIRNGYLAIFGSLAITLILALVFRVHQGRIELIQKQTQRKLEVSEERTQSVISNAMDGIITFNETGNIELFNPSAERMFGYRSGDIIGQSIFILLDPESQEELRGAIQNFKVDPNYGGGWSRELNGRTQGGEAVQLELSISQMHPHGVHKFIGIFRNITERKQNQIRINRLHRQNELILSSVADGIFGMDLKGDISFINPAGEKLLGYEPGELNGQHAHLVLHPPLQPWTQGDSDAHDLFLPLNNKVTCIGKDPLFWGKDGCSFPAEFVSTSIIEDDKIVGAVVTFRNVQARIKAENALKNYALDLEKMNEELQNFTFVASHDLQEPLRKVMTLTDMLKETQWKKMTKKGKDALERTQKSIDRMQQLIYDLLDYFQSTARDSAIESTDLEEEAKNALVSMEEKIRAVNAEVLIDDLPTIQACPFQMRKLFEHLISNSLKFRQEKVTPTIGITGEWGENNNWIIRVQDNGIGFDEKYLDRIFRPFQRLHDKSEYSGSGIGLAICEKIVTRHRGTITALSRPGTGSQFIITLPHDLHKAELPALHSNPPENPAEVS